MMFDKAPDLSPDLEWMLRSNQVSDDLILESLLEEYLVSIYQLFLSLSVDPNIMVLALAETFSNVLIERKRFANQLDVKSYVYSQAIQVYHRRKLRSTGCQPAGFPLLDEIAEAPQIHLPQEYYIRVTDSARSLLDRKKLSEQMSSRLTQVLLGGLVAALILAIGWITNRIAALESPSPLAVQTVLETQIVHITVIVTGTPLPDRSPEGLSVNTNLSFDPASSRLAFRWRESLPAQTERIEAVPVDVYADGYYLGQMQITDPWTSSCVRSPDGRYLALVERPDLPPFPLTRLRLLQVQELKSLDEPLPKGSRYGNDVAFSPDSNYLVFWGCAVKSECGVYLLDLSDQEVVMLLPGRYAGYFTWSPDGEEIAMLRSNGNFSVVNTSSGEITYEHMVDWVKKDIPPEAPINNWGIAFPPVQGDLRGCEGPGVS